MLKNILVISIILISCNGLQAQEIKGIVYSKELGIERPLQQAGIFYPHLQIGTFSDSAGNFTIEKKVGQQLVINYVGLNPDTVLVTENTNYIKVVLQPDNLLSEATVIRRKEYFGINNLESRLQLEIGEQEFQRAACCNLSEGFETNPAIDVSYNDAVTGTKQIRMLGLSGKYVLLGMENIPAIRGLGAVYGLDLIPASYISGIHLTKGNGPIQFGTESLTGQINLELKEPDGEEKYLLDLFGSASGRTEIDGAFTLGNDSGVSSRFMGKIAVRPFEVDNNGDGFLDFPLQNQYNIYNRTKFNFTDNWKGQIGVNYIYDDKKGGQFAKSLPSPYTVDLFNERIQVWAKSGIIFKNKPYQSLGMQYGYTHHKLNFKSGNPTIGQRNYTGTEQNGFANIMLSTLINANKKHKILYGVNTFYDDINEQLDSFGYHRSEWISGLYTEYTFSPTHDFDVVVGLRGNYNSVYGWALIPRFHMRYAMNEDKTTLRLTGGRGLRTPRYLAENLPFLVNNRSFDFDPSLLNNRESSWNTGLSLAHEFTVSYRPATLLFDYFYTHFESQLITDNFTSASQLGLYYNNSLSNAHSAQLSLSYKLHTRIELRGAYRYVYVNYNGQMAPLVPNHRALITANISTRKQWGFDITANAVGSQKTPRVDKINGERAINKTVDPFVILNLQVSKKWLDSGVEIYGGTQNTLNYKQQNPIVNAAQPYAANFDATAIYAPIMGIMPYLGLRWRINKSKEE